MTVPSNNQPFSIGEFEQRWSSVGAAMDAYGVDAIIVTNSHNMAWLTGYAGTSSYIPQAALYRRGDQYPYLILRKQDVPAGIHTTPLPRDNIVGYPEALIGNPDKDGHDFVRQFLQDLGGLRTIGLEFEEVSHPTYEKYRGGLAPLNLVDVSTLISEKRRIKSEREISLMKEAGKVVETGVLAAFEAARPGRRECDVAGDVVKALASGVDAFETIRIEVPEMAFGPRIGTGHYHWYEGTLEHGCQINFELVGVRHLYQVPLMRTISLGPPSDKLQRLFGGVREGLEEALSIIKPGATCCDVANAFYRKLGEHGFEKDSRCGYTIGLTTAENPSLQSSDQTVLEPNMTFHLMLGTWPEEDFGVTLSESFRVTETGYETFSSLSRDLYIV